MRTLVTGSAGRVGRAICIRLGAEHEVIGLDTAPSSTTDIVGSVEDAACVRRALAGVEAVVHTAALHAPHVGHVPASTFEAVNVRATEALARLAADAGVRSFVFTSTTALYGSASTCADRAAWIDEDVPPHPRTVYHRTKLEAEHTLRAIAAQSSLPVTVIRMSRCFPEPVPLMAVYRLHRGVDVRDVADAHAAAALGPVAGFRTFVVSGRTPFLPEDAGRLLHDAPAVIERRCPALAGEFRRRGWVLPRSIDRVYCPRKATRELGWQPVHGFEEVLAQYERRSLEVLPPRRRWSAET